MLMCCGLVKECTHEHGNMGAQGESTRRNARHSAATAIATGRLGCSPTATKAVLNALMSNAPQRKRCMGRLSRSLMCTCCASDRGPAAVILDKLLTSSACFEKITQS